MSFTLGIDTGGTYTDGVVVDTTCKKVLFTAKALTTHMDLKIGIRECFNNLKKAGAKFDCLEQVSLSTTLATNAIVEGRGCEAGLILIGGEKNGRLPARQTVAISGGHDLYGNRLCEIDREALLYGIGEIDQEVETYAVSGYFAVRNPEHEMEARSIIRKATGKPVVCAYELSSTLGYYERTVTAILNARLLPMIADLTGAVKHIMDEFAVQAPLVIVKGDGTSIGEAAAIERPIETLLSGPAASVVGARYLSGKDDFVVVDMGGTTSDIAVVENGCPEISPSGACVGGWRTHVQASDITTVGQGGDSWIQVDARGIIHVGPRKAIPVSYIASEYPYLENELKDIYENNIDKYRPYFSQPADILVFNRDPIAGDLSDDEIDILNSLRNSPHTFYHTGRRLHKITDTLPIGRLLERGFVRVASLTPTDVLHYLGKMNLWDSTAATVAVALEADRAELTKEVFCEDVLESVIIKISQTLLGRMIWQDDHSFIGKDDDVKRLFEKMLLKNKKEKMGIRSQLNVPLVAIGAPVDSYFPQIAEKLGADLILVEHREVANAIGAAVSEIVRKVTVTIRPARDECYVVYAPWGKAVFDTLDDAVQKSIASGHDHFSHEANKYGMISHRVETERHDSYSKVATSWGTDDQGLFIESILVMTAIGKGAH